jgi:hypothetical protein
MQSNRVVDTAMSRLAFTFFPECSANFSLFRRATTIFRFIYSTFMQIKAFVIVKRDGDCFTLSARLWRGMKLPARDFLAHKNKSERARRLLALLLASRP